MIVEQKMKFFWHKKSTSTSRQICVGISFILGIAVILVSLALFIQFLNIKQQQQAFPNKFFAFYDKLSLLSIAKTNKNLILENLDFKRNFINMIRKSLIDNWKKIGQKTSEQARKIISQSQTIQCVFSNPNQTIFSCKMDQQTDFLLKVLNIFQLSLPIKRYNIYYQNRVNKNDIMLKSLSRNKISNLNITSINENIQNIREGKFIFSDFYRDYYEKNKNWTMSYRGKLTFPNYTILLEQEGFGSFIKNSIAVNFYSDDINAMVLLRDDSRLSGYNLISRLRPLSTEINYTKLLQPGYHQSILPNGDVIYSFTEPFPSQFAIQSKVNTNQTNGKGNHVLIVHSPSMSKDMKRRTMSFIDNLLSSLIILLAFGFVVLIFFILAITLYATQIIKKSLKEIKENVYKYLNKVQLTVTIIKVMLQFKSSLQLFNIISKSIYDIIKEIDHKKRRHYKMAKSLKENDYFPLNLNESSFKKRYLLKYLDDIKICEIRDRVKYLQFIQE